MSALQFIDFFFKSTRNATSENLVFFFNVVGRVDKRTSVVSLKRGIFTSSALIRTSLKTSPKMLRLLTCCTLTNM